MKADPTRRMLGPLAALGGHSQSEHLHPLSINHAGRWSCKCVIVRRCPRENVGVHPDGALPFSVVIGLSQRALEEPHRLTIRLPLDT